MGCYIIQTVASDSEFREEHYGHWKEAVLCDANLGIVETVSMLQNTMIVVI